MNELVVVEGKEVERIEYKGQPVLSLPMVDELHQRPEGTAGRNFRENREHFTLNEDFHELPYEEWSVLMRRNSSSQVGDSSSQNDAGGFRGSMVFLTLTGYLMLTKTLKDTLSWNIQRVLVKSYFKLKEIQVLAQKDIAYFELKDKYTTLLEKHIALCEKKLAKRKPLPLEERNLIYDMHKQGVANSEIAKRIGRSHAAVSNIISYGVSSGRLKKDN